MFELRPPSLAIRRIIRARSIAQIGLVCALSLGVLSACAGPNQAVSAKSPSSETPAQLVREAEALARVGETIRAEQYFSAALEMGANPAAVLPKLVSICVRAGRFRSALSYASPYLREQSENIELRYLIATLYAGIGDADRAIRELDQVLARKADHAPALHLAGELLLERGDYANAEQRLVAYLKLQPNGPDAVEVREQMQRMQRTLPSSSQNSEEVL